LSLGALVARPLSLGGQAAVGVAVLLEARLELPLPLLLPSCGFVASMSAHHSAPHHRPPSRPIQRATRLECALRSHPKQPPKHPPRHPPRHPSRSMGPWRPLHGSSLILIHIHIHMGPWRPLRGCRNGVTPRMRQPRMRRALSRAPLWQRRASSWAPLRQPHTRRALSRAPLRQRRARKRCCHEPRHRQHRGPHSCLQSCTCRSPHTLPLGLTTRLPRWL